MDSVSDDRGRRSSVVPSHGCKGLIPIPPALRGRLAVKPSNEARHRLNLLWPQWLACWDAAVHPAVDVLDAEEFASLYEAFKGLRLLGVKFDETFTLAIEYLAGTLKNTDADPDQDNDDPDDDNDYDFSENLQPEWKPYGIIQIGGERC